MEPRQQECVICDQSKKSSVNDPLAPRKERANWFSSVQKDTRRILERGRGCREKGGRSTYRGDLNNDLVLIKQPFTGGDREWGRAQYANRSKTILLKAWEKWAHTGRRFEGQRNQNPTGEIFKGECSEIWLEKKKKNQKAILDKGD